MFFFAVSIHICDFFAVSRDAFSVAGSLSCLQTYLSYRGRQIPQPSTAPGLRLNPLPFLRVR